MLTRRGIRWLKLKSTVLGLTEENEIREGAVSAFKVLLSTVGNWRSDISGLSFTRLAFY